LFVSAVTELVVGERDRPMAVRGVAEHRAPERTAEIGSGVRHLGRSRHFWNQAGFGRFGDLIVSAVLACGVSKFGPHRRIAPVCRQNWIFCDLRLEQLVVVEQRGRHATAPTHRERVARPGSARGGSGGRCTDPGGRTARSGVGRLVVLAACRF
jgi:hypothetical protein